VVGGSDVASAARSPRMDCASSKVLSSSRAGCFPSWTASSWADLSYIHRVAQHPKNGLVAPEPVAGAGVGLGCWLVLRGLYPPRPPLAAVLARLDGRLGPTPVPIDAEVGGGLALRLGRPLTGVVAGSGIGLPRLWKDLAVTGRSLVRHLGEKVGLAILGALIAPATAAGLALGGAALPLAVPVWASLVLGLGGFFVPDLGVRAEAAARGRDFRNALGSFLDLVVIALAGRRPPPGRSASGLAAHVGQVGPGRGRARHRRRGQRFPRPLPPQRGHQPGQLGGDPHLMAADDRRLGRAGRRHHHGRAGRRHHHGGRLQGIHQRHHPRDGPHGAVQTQLAQEGQPGHRLGGHGTGRHQQPDGHGQVEPGAHLADRRRRQVDRHPAGEPGQVAGQEGGPDTVARLPAGGVGQPTMVKPGTPPRRGPRRSRGGPRRPAGWRRVRWRSRRPPGPSSGRAAEGQCAGRSRQAAL